MPNAEFWSRHEANRQSPRYQKMRREMMDADPNCAGCGLRYVSRGYNRFQRQMDHKRYRDAWGRLIFGREKKSDFRLMCPDCHGKGVTSDFKVSQDRRAIWWIGVLEWGVGSLARMVLWLLALPLRSAMAAFRPEEPTGR